MFKVNGDQRKKTTPGKKKDVNVTIVTPDDFAQECLAAHNEKRSLHKAPPLRLSRKVFLIINSYHRIVR